MNGTPDTTLQGQVPDSVVLGKAEECDVIAIVADIEGYRVTVAVECASIGNFSAPANAQVSTDIGKKHGIHVLLSLGSLHEVTELSPIVGSTDAKDIRCRLGERCGGGHENTVFHRPAIAEIVQKAFLVGYCCYRVSRHDGNHLAVDNLPVVNA